MLYIHVDSLTVIIQKMNSMYEHTSSDLLDIDICNTSSSYSPHRNPVTITSTPCSTYRPRVNFHSIESLASSPVTPFSSPCQKQDNSFTTEVRVSKCNERKSRRKLSDWQVWYLNQIYVQNRYPSPHDHEEIAARLSLPTSSIRVWFQNHRARYGKS
ncbi:hypothetical protein I4U23_012078 [Adineta vaga]|nr:hypothetical protein I4U23_012078 [Adineta vaga]